MENNQLARAGQGLRKIYLSQVLSILAMVCAILLAVAALFTLGSAVGYGDDLATAGGAGLTVILTIGTLALMLVSFIFYLMGLSKAGDAHPSFKTAMTVVIASIVVAVVSSFVKEGFFAVVLDIVSTALEVAAVHFVCEGASELLRSVGEDALAVKGDNVRAIHLICGGIEILCALLECISALSGAASILTGVGGIAGLVGLVMYMIFLKKSSVCLSAASGAMV